jgi:hypothetical protein
MKLFIVAGLLLVAACSRPAAAPTTDDSPDAQGSPGLQASPPARTPARAEAPSEAAFAGLWRVSAVDGAPPPGAGSPILVRIDSEGVTARADCAFLGDARYAVEGAALRLTPPPSGLVTSCARGLSALENAFTDVFKPGAVARLVGEELVLENAGRSVVLRRPPTTPVRLALLEPSAAGDASMISGSLEAEGPCLYLRVVYGDRYLPAFHTPDTRWDAATGVLHVGDKRFTHGSRVRLGGSFSTGAPPPRWRQAPDPSCVASRTWVAASVGPDPSPRPGGYTGEEIERMRAEDAAK